MHPPGVAGLSRTLSLLSASRGLGGPNLNDSSMGGTIAARVTRVLRGPCVIMGEIRKGGIQEEPKHTSWGLDIN